jgi:hypothetical protein
MLYTVHPDDPLSCATVMFVLGVVTMLACYIPARRATRVDPMFALRYEFAVFGEAFGETHLGRQA